LDEFKGRWAATQSIAPGRLAELRQVATIESVGSSTRIEGVKLSNTEIEALLKGVNTYSFRSRDEQEIAGYAELMDIIYSSYKEIPFSENHIKQLHTVLLKYSAKDDRHRGEYKKFSNNVEAFDTNGKSLGIIVSTASAFDTPSLMKELIEWSNTQLIHKKMHPLLTISLFVIVFLHIHPFQDGNGRLSRALTTLLLLQQGYSFVPYSSFERVIEENKDSYYMALRNGQKELENMSNHKNQSENGLQLWLEFFLKSLQKQKQSLESKIKTELILNKIPHLSLEIVELIKSRGPTSIAETTLATKANRNTIKVRLKNLVKDGYLKKNGIGRGIKYRIKS